MLRHPLANPRARGMLFVSTLALAVTLWPVVPASADHAIQVPCTDPRGCPDLVVDPETFDPSVHTRNFRENSCAVVEGMIEAGERTVLQFTYTTPNFGAGDLIVGDPEDHPEWFEFSACHEHFHFREYADYRLWTPEHFAAWDDLRNADPLKPAADVLAENPGLAPVEGHKQGFCVIDVVLYDIAPPKYLVCEFQGISVGWADEYHDDLDGQWIDVTGLPAGDYVLEAEVNPEHFFEEEDYGNDRAFQDVTI